MKNQTIICERYVKALLDLAIAGNKVAPVREDMATIASLISQNTIISEAMANATYPVEERLAALLALLKNHEPSPLTKNFLSVVAKNDRLSLLAPIAEAFADAANAHDGIKSVAVTVPYELKAPLRKKIESTLRDVFGKDINLTVKIDTSLLDGLQVKVGSLLYDASLKKQLNDLQQSLITATKLA